MRLGYCFYKISFNLLMILSKIIIKVLSLCKCILNSINVMNGRWKIEESFRIMKDDINEYIKSGQTNTTKFFLMMPNRMGHTIQVMQRTYIHSFPRIQDEIVNLLDEIS